jgi:hypothetical protein
MMKRTILLVSGLLFISSAATAGPNWQSLTLDIQPANLPKVMAALDELMESVAPGDKGSAALMGNVAGGESSHTFISSFESRAAREIWGNDMRSSAAYADFAKATSGLIERGGSSRMDFVKSWGAESDKNVFWEIFAFTVTDAAAFSAALDEFMNSEAGKKFKGQVHLSRVAAAGLAQSTHLISVGFESETAAEAWDDEMAGNKELASYRKASREAGTLGGAYMIRTLKAWEGSDD